ncbi:MAG: bifunctional 4-hydroxy-2-oxoglutarate aldolase/2-dehydro-3-deoxy-phosphogluconate aldolase [Rhodothermales bacterium]|nr:bifunctional 4-hydroxy-2-oxoglutarate aldolase/2-dehydro-3-deoxy-phosphogluconate aldolase [Rhodothermales bacterium]
MRSEIVDRIVSGGVVAVIRLDDAAVVLPVLRALREGGITALEVTMTTPGALGLIEAAADEFHRDEAVTVGVGSVFDSTTARRAIDAGARFVVSPIFSKSVIEESHRHDVPAFPGAMTPTEIQAATDFGADIVKVFPSGVVGMAFFKAVMAPMPRVKLMPTGGVTLTNAGDWFNAGACVVGVGSALLDAEAIGSGDFTKLSDNARTLVENVRRAKAALEGG